MTQLPSTDTQLMLAVMTLSSLVLFWQLKQLNRRLDKVEDKVERRMDKIERGVTYLKIMTPQAVDFWDERNKNMKAPFKRPTHLLTDVLKHYYGEILQGEKPLPAQCKCIVTGLVGTNVSKFENKHQITAAHLMPRNLPDVFFKNMGLEPHRERDGMQSMIPICKRLGEAFDKKQISFQKVEGADDFVMKIWDDSVRGTPVWPVHSEAKKQLREELEQKTPKIGAYEDGKHKFRFPEDKMPFTRILAYHNAVCFHSAIERGLINEEQAMQHSQHTFSGSPLSATHGHQHQCAAAHDYYVSAGHKHSSPAFSSSIPQQGSDMTEDTEVSSPASSTQGVSTKLFQSEEDGN